MTLKLIRIRRLKQLQADRGAAGPVALGKLIGRKANQTSDLLYGRAPFGERVARSIEEHAGLPLGWLDDDDREHRGGDRKHPREQPTDAAFAVSVLRDSVSDDQAEVFAPPLRLEKRWLDRLPPFSNVENLRLFHASDDGMQPTFGRGDALLVDVGVRQLRRDGVHLLQVNSRIHVRRIRMRIDGSVEVSEDSPTLRTVEVIPAANLKLVGRVIWAWAGRAP